MSRKTVKVATSIFNADFIPRRQTRSFAASLQAFTYSGDVLVRKVEQGGKREQLSDDDSPLSSLGSRNSFDIEDAPFGASNTRKRKRGFDSPSTAVPSIHTVTSTRMAPRKVVAEEEDGTVGKTKKGKRQPAKRMVNEAGEEEVEPPANWSEIYDAVREMRKEKLAPVDTMGCETLAEEHLTPRVSCASLLLQILLKKYLGQTFPNPYSSYAILSNQRHYKRNRHAPPTDRTPFPRPHT